MEMHAHGRREQVWRSSAMGGGEKRMLRTFPQWCWSCAVFCEDPCLAAAGIPRFAIT